MLSAADNGEAAQTPCCGGPVPPPVLLLCLAELEQAPFCAHLTTTLTSSKSFTFGIAGASSALRSLNHDLFAVNDVDAPLRLAQALAAEGVACLALPLAAGRVDG